MLHVEGAFYLLSRTFDSADGGALKIGTMGLTIPYDSVSDRPDYPNKTDILSGDCFYYYFWVYPDIYADWIRVDILTPYSDLVRDDWAVCPDCQYDGNICENPGGWYLRDSLFANEGGAAREAVRSAIGYSRKDAEFELSPYVRNGSVSFRLTSCAKFTNNLSWIPHLLETETIPESNTENYFNSDEWWQDYPSAYNLGFPWQEPIQNDPDKYPPAYSGSDDNVNDELRSTAWKGHALPQTTSFLVLERESEEDNVLIASTKFKDTVILRNGQTLVVPFSGALSNYKPITDNVDTGMTSETCLETIVDTALCGNTHTVSNWRFGLSEKPLSELPMNALASSVELQAGQAVGYESITASGVEVAYLNEQRSGSTVTVGAKLLVKKAGGYWQNTGATAWPTVKSVCVFADVDGSGRLMWAQSIDPAALAADQKFTLSSTGDDVAASLCLYSKEESL